MSTYYFNFIIATMATKPYLLLKAKFKLPAYALVLFRALRFTLNTTLSPAAKVQLAGSAVVAAVPFCQSVCTPVDTATGEPHAVRPAVVFLYVW